MATGTLGGQPRQFDWQATHYLRKTINWNDAGIATADTASNLVGILPQGAFIKGVFVEVVTTFNAGATNVITVGTNTGTDNNIVASGDVNAGAAAVYEATRGYGRSIANAAFLKVFAVYTQTGGAATQGQAVIVIEYVPNNDK